MDVAALGTGSPGFPAQVAIRQRRRTHRTELELTRPVLMHPNDGRHGNHVLVGHNGAVNRPPLFAPAALLAAAIAWTLTLAFGEPVIGSAAAAVAAIDLLLIVVVIIVGLVVARARWARRFSIVALTLMAALALTMAVSNNWIIALILSGLAVVAVTGPSLDGLGSPPAGSGPPPKAVLLALTLLVVPAVVALATQSPIPWSGWLAVVLAPVTAWGYGRTFPWALWTARVILPALLVISAPGSSWWGVALLLVAAVFVAWLAWGPDARLAVFGAPPEQGGRAVPMPPQLVPREVLSAAGLDEDGRVIGRREDDVGGGPGA